jgi:hypothetical protein
MVICSKVAVRPGEPRSAHGVPVRPLFGAKWFGGGGGSYEKSSLFISFSTVFCHFSVFLSLGTDP